MAVVPATVVWSEKATVPAPPQPANPPVAAPADATPAAPAPAADPSVPAPPENPYNLIPIRNAFGLASPPPPQEEAPPVPPPAPPITVKLSGMTDLVGRKVAFLVLTETGPNKTPKSRQLGEGEKESGVEVVAIDFTTRSVKVNNNGVVTNVTFGKLEASAGTTPAATGAGGTRVLPNFNNPGGNPVPPPPIPPGGGNAMNAEGNNSVIIGGQGGGEAGPRGGIGRSGGVFTSGAYPTGGTASPAATSYASPSVSSPTTFSGGGSLNASLPNREPRVASPAGRTGTPRFQVPMPPPLPDPTEFSRGSTSGTGQ